MHENGNEINGKTELSPLDIRFKLLREHGKTFRDLDREWNLNIGTVGRVVNRSHLIVRLDIRQRLADLLGIDVEQIGRDPKKENCIHYDSDGNKRDA